MKKLITLFGALLIGSTGITKAQWANKIVFSVPANSPAEDSVCYINNDGTGLSFINNGYWPRVNYQNNRIAFMQGSVTDRTMNDVYFKDGNNTPYLYYTNGGYAMINYDFSPSGYYFQFDWQGNFYRMESALPNSSSTNIGSGAGDFNDVYPRLSTVDSQIVFHNKNYGLYLMPFAGQGNTDLIPNTVPGDLYPCWSPDGQWVYFMKQYAGAEGMHNIYKIHPNGSGLTQVTNLKTTDTLGSTLIITKNGKWAVAPARIKGVTGIYKFRINQATPDTLGYLIRAFNYLPSPCNSLWIGSADSVNDDISMAIEQPLSLQASVFPNPITDNIHVELQQKEEQVTVELVNLVGEIVLQENRKQTSEVLLNTATVTPGIYLLQVRAATKQYTTRIIKQ